MFNLGEALNACSKFKLAQDKICRCGNVYSFAFELGIKLLGKRSQSTEFSLINETLIQSYFETDTEFQKLSNEQIIAVKLFLSGKSLFLTGIAGGGKSFVIKYLKRVLENKHSQQQFSILASTGLAADIIGGITYQSFLGCHTDSEYNKMAPRMKSQFYNHRIKLLKFLIIDECSMIDSKTIDSISSVLQEIRNNKANMGGIFVLFSGDFLQLPPVNGRAFYYSKVYRSLSAKVYLSKNYRTNHKEFQTVIDKVRLCNVDDQVKEFIKSKQVTLEVGFDSKTTYLRAFKAECSQINDFFLSRIDSVEFSYKAIDSTKDQEEFASVQAPETLKLRKGAKVMMIFNVDFEKKLLNGRIGTVVDFRQDVPCVSFDGEIYPITRQKFTGMKGGEREQIPLILAWAITIHKAQGLSLSCKTDISMKNCSFAKNSFHVGLSRPTDPNLLSIRDIDYNQITTDSEALKENQNILLSSQTLLEQIVNKKQKIKD